MRINQIYNQNGEIYKIQPKNFGNILITTDKFTYFAGEIISGNICLNVIGGEFLGCILYLGFTGKEKCQWEETDTEIETNPKRVCTGKSYILQDKVELHTFESPLQPYCQYVFPFQFYLTSHLPSSYYEKDKAQISYKVKAFVQSKKFPLPFLKHSQQLMIREQLQNYNYSLIKQVTSSFCCFQRKGACYFSCTIDKSYYLPGEEVNLTIDIDNSDLNQPLNYLEIYLNHQLTLIDNQQNYHFEIENKPEQRIAGVEARGKKKLKIQYCLRNNDPLIKLQPSTKGKLIQSEYQLVIQPHIQSYSCTKEWWELKAMQIMSFKIEILQSVFENNLQLLKEPFNENSQVFQIQKVCLTDRNKQEKQQMMVKYIKQKIPLRSQIQLMQQTMKE
ncbi:unnamed protein product [Paramecium sonneborni]|uniref:Arrestin C-terminal-like domain-containing protein n=1 Tax=Paramecium sonneborni TaxID=65129 RepID=A0A8S1ND70_9CILI|nr:unnamed protein product [Paramecium sonneborni]